MPRFMEEAHGWAAVHDWDMFADCLQNRPPKLSLTFRSANQYLIKLLFSNAKMAVQAVSSEPVPPEFPVKQGKNREFSVLGSKRT